MSEPMNRPVVVKVGGSLLDWPEFPARLSAYLGAALGRAVLVVGGGKTVEVLRALDSLHAIGENRAHALALRALDVTAGVVAAVVPALRVVERPEEVAGVWEEGRTPVLAPRWFMEHVDKRSTDPLPERWATTSDSIAARVARHLGADGLVLLKSTAPDGDVTSEEAARLALIDPVFPRAARGLGWVRLVNLRADPPRAVSVIGTNNDHPGFCPRGGAGASGGRG
jgi:aspartokinase-like uncharacterized kinase